MMLVVELFGVASPGRGRTPGPVYTTVTGPTEETATGPEYITRQSGPYCPVPKGAEFFDVTDGLVDVATGRPLFEVGEGMMEKLEDAKISLKRMEERWVWTSASLFPRRG